jgi:hypothetical protein
MSSCAECGSLLQVEAFPALVRENPPAMPTEKVIEDKTAACFYHMHKKAVVPCDTCGRFLCALCDVEFLDKHICPTCLTHAKKIGKIKNLENRRILYDNLSLALAVYPMLFVFPTLITAPLSIFVAVRYWKKSIGIVPRTRIRHVVAVILSCLQIAGWVLVFHDIFA